MITCQYCKNEALHLYDLRCQDNEHRNKVILIFYCDACGEKTEERAWGHIGPKKKFLELLTDSLEEIETMEDIQHANR